MATESDRASKTVAAGTLVLIVLGVTQFLMTLDTSVMNVSISALVKDLDATVTEIQGVITAYTLVMAAAMITGGKVGDLLGRRRALRIGLVIYACGSGLTAIAPNVVVLLIGWSILEGLGAALIMPTVTALIAGNFTGKKRASAYATIAAAAAIAVGVGPIIGGFVTTEYSWRYVFAAEVVVAIGLIFAAGVVVDVPAEEKPKLDLVGAFLSALGLAMVVFGVLQSSTWGWISPRISDGPDKTPQWFGISLTTWLILGGLGVLWYFLAWQRRRVAHNQSPLVDPELFKNRQLTGGLVMILMQYSIMMGMFFAMPLFLSIVLGLSAFDTGVRMLPLSLALVITAPTVPRLFSRVGPRRIVNVGLLLMLVAALLLAARLQDGADASITTLPFILMGIGMGALASQLGNVTVSAVSVERGGEAGGLQYTAQNLGASLGTALIGGVVIAALGTILLGNIQNDPEISAAVKQQAQVTLSANVQFVSDAQLEAALATTSIPPAEQQAIIADNADARLKALQRGMIAVAFFTILALFMSRRLPKQPLIPADATAVV